VTIHRWVAPPNFVAWPDGHDMTIFQRSVCAAVEQLRPGELATYGEIAEEIGRPGSAQAVANVLRHASDLPWWRVIPGDGRLYRTHEPTQRPILEAEGHHIDSTRRVGSNGSDVHTPGS
jgi:methylated-DNA-protein-cysteine methyltransferase related protein